MPELPEVEVVRQSLEHIITHKKVKKVIVRNRNLRLKIPKNFIKSLVNKKVIKVDRFSKYIILQLNNKSFLILHLGMSGTIHLIDKYKKNFSTNMSFYNSPNLPKKHNHIEIFFKNFKIVYNDPRRFGFVQIIKNFEYLKKRFAKYGPEPFQKKFDTNYMLSFFKGKKRNIKNFLLDQNFVSGIGNIYASEILFLSKIKPTTLVNILKFNDCKKIINKSKFVLLKAIEKGGSSIKNFKNAKGYTGNFQKNFNVYQRDGLKCKRSGCEGIIKKKIISNRSTFFCDYCQK